MVVRALLFACAVSLAATTAARAGDPQYVYPQPSAPTPQIISHADHPPVRYGFNRPTYSYGWFGARYHERKHVHRGYNNDSYWWGYRRGY